MFLHCDYGKGVDYSGGDGYGQKTLESYKGFKVSEDGQEDKIFMSADPPEDFRSASNYIAERIKEIGEYCSMSSDVDHFVSDCDDIFQWYTTASGAELFDWTEKAEELEAKHKEERTKHSTAVWNLLQKLGVPEDIARQDTIQMFHSCSHETFLALSKHMESLS